MRKLFVSKYQHHGVNFHFYGSEQQVKMLSAVFCDHGALTKVLIPQCITLCLHAWCEPLKGFFNQHVIKGSCGVQLDYKPMLSLFSTVVKQLPNNLFVHLNKPQLNPPTADVEPPKKRIKSSKTVMKKSTDIVFPIGLGELTKLQQLGKQRKFTYHPDVLEAQRLDMLMIDVITVIKIQFKKFRCGCEHRYSKKPNPGYLHGKKGIHQ